MRRHRRTGKHSCNPPRNPIANPSPTIIPPDLPMPQLRADSVCLKMRHPAHHRREFIPPSALAPLPRDLCQIPLCHSPFAHLLQLILCITAAVQPCPIDPPPPTVESLPAPQPCKCEPMVCAQSWPEVRFPSSPPPPPSHTLPVLLRPGPIAQT
ncbi:uncharacterized protein BDZ99DRAFT_180074 [Mytilinidion resinicola]|uniref:Uncharacterized protein n=1 Tax=Mytilinidion resinicola TaxID=574789 RepID=A0A6A6Z1F2_9PEZI|nr:uncharacterized protein BDZ99DRAFT_180074 [Mytilinidion resinicola]KAF2814549.1 hypothetical protein BDZ99DRAFT_180074 [Mytilinidion resinicola]